MRERFLRLRFQRKLILAFMGIVLVPTMILSLVINRQSFRRFEANLLEVERRAMELTQSKIEYLLSTARNAAILTASDRSLTRTLEKCMDAARYTVGDQILDFFDLRSTLATLQYMLPVRGIRVFLPEDSYFAHERVNFFSMEDLRAYPWYAALARANGSVIWTAPHEVRLAGESEPTTVLSASNLIYSYSRFSEPIGCVSADVALQSLSDALKGSSAHGALLCLVSGGECFASSDACPEAALGWIAGAEPARYADWAAVNAGGRYYVQSVPVENTDWSLMVFVPETAIHAAYQHTGSMIFVAALLLAVLAFPVSVLVARSLTKRIRALELAMQAESGEPALPADARGCDEITSLEQSFHRMLTHIDGLTAEKIRIAQEAKSFELQSLQAQINPHFLYNTLELISNLARKHQADDVVELVQSLAIFYRLSLSKGRDIIPISDELAQIDTYMQIQNQRFDHAIRFEISADDAILDCQIPKLVLQPIVENAILHGILEKDPPRGSILVNGERQDDFIVITVADDGVGLSESRLADFSKPQPSMQGSGYGIHNVDYRIKLFYGADCGIAFASTPGEGTVVTLRLRAIPCKS